LTPLLTPPVARVVPEGVFDAFAWCPSDVLDWRRSEWDATTPLTSTNPPKMAFVMRSECTFLPRELARLHVPGLGLGDEWALAPYAIDDATDGLCERRVRPGDLLWLAAESLAGLVWGLHDWAHFHNHGPFDERAWTELQCDLAALAWLWLNRSIVDVTDEAWELKRREVIAVARARFDEERKPFDETWLAAHRVRELASGGGKLMGAG
jgi:hypothetical protein